MSLLDAALEYAANGFAVFPCQPRGKEPVSCSARAGTERHCRKDGAMNAVTPIVEAKLDPRYAFLVRASIRLLLVDYCEMDIGEAFDGLLASLQCSCTHALVEKSERDHPRRRQATQQRRPTPQPTFDAVLHCVSQRGLAALKEPANIDRISRMTADERVRLDARIEKVISGKSN